MHTSAHGDIAKRASFVIFIGLSLLLGIGPKIETQIPNYNCNRRIGSDVLEFQSIYFDDGLPLSVLFHLIVNQLISLLK